MCALENWLENYQSRNEDLLEASFPDDDRLEVNLSTGTQLGQGLTEYAIILMLVALIVIVVLALIAPPVGNVFSNIVTNL